MSGLESSDCNNAKSPQSITANLTNLNSVCGRILGQISDLNHIIFLLQGDIGAGKTTLVQSFAKFIGIKDIVTSPTFSLLHIYGNLQDLQKIFHYDLFNRNLGELLDLGLLDLLEERGIHFVEWGDSKLFAILKNAFENIYIISITKTKNMRIYTFKESI